MRETEITVQVFNSLDGIQNTLIAQGFALKETCVMEDWYYSSISSDTLKTMDYSDIIKNSFLLRSFNGEDDSASVCYKNKTIDDLGNVISEEKVKCKIDSLEKSKKVYELAGVNNWCYLKQEMFIYKKDEIQFAVQVADGVGIFIEHEEDETMKMMTEQEKIDCMLTRLKNLGLKIGEDYSCKKVYMKFMNQ